MKLNFKLLTLEVKAKNDRLYLLVPTCVDEASGGAFAELFGFVRQRDLHHPWDVPRRRLHSDGMRGDQLRKARQDKGINIVKLYTQT